MILDYKIIEVQYFAGIYSQLDRIFELVYISLFRASGRFVPKLH